MKKILVLLVTSIAVLSPLAAMGAKDGDASAAAKGPLVWVWYPNESTPEFAPARSAIIELAAKTLGREIKEQTTTDYNIAIEDGSVVKVTSRLMPRTPRFFPS